MAVGKESSRQIRNMFRNYDEYDQIVDWLFGGSGKIKRSFKDDF